MLDFDFWTFRTRVTFGESRYSDIEVISVLLANVFDEIDSVVEPSFSRFPFFYTSRWISS
jgi:hypothetical protein